MQQQLFPVSHVRVFGRLEALLGIVSAVFAMQSCMVVL